MRSCTLLDHLVNILHLPGKSLCEGLFSTCYNWLFIASVANSITGFLFCFVYSGTGSRTEDLELTRQGLILRTSILYRLNCCSYLVSSLLNNFIPEKNAFYFLIEVLQNGIFSDISIPPCLLSWSLEFYTISESVSSHVLCFFI